jgi:cyclic-di-AMP phosphodiesterase PgpH
MKPPLPIHRRLNERLAQGAKAFHSSLSDQAVIDALAGLFMIVGLSILILRNYQRNPVAALPAGTIATADIIAPTDLKITDNAETERLRSLAEASVLPVFDYSPRAAKEMRNGIETMFQLGRDAPPGTPRDELLKKIRDASGIVLDSEQFGVLSRHRFNSELEHLFIDRLDSVMITGIVSSRGQLRVGANGIVRRDLKTGQEVTVSDLTSIRDLITARAALRSDNMAWPAEYRVPERRLLTEILGTVIVPNLSYNEIETEARRLAARRAVVPVSFSVERNKPIVVMGETVSPAKAALLDEAARHRPTGELAVQFAGTVVIVMLLLLVLWQYLVRYQNKHLRVRRHFVLQVISFVITLGVARLFFALANAMSQWTTIAPFDSQMGYRYLAPLAAGAILVTILTDAQAAFVFSATLAAFIGVLTGDVHLATYTLVSSVGAIYHLQKCRDRTALMRAGLWIGIVNAAAALSLDLLGANELRLDRLPFDAACGYLGGLLATMLASILLPLFEWLFEITTSFKLLELSNLNLPLLKQLAERAPGTYHHSIMVGLLAEAGAEAIGADALFARVACYYHDIGKMVRPSYFIENQSLRDNRHDKLSPKMSSLVLANHVKQGIELARQYRLPSRLVSIIPQHHGTGLMKYFYYKALKEAEASGSSALEHEFRYPGPKPQSKEAAIIMIADSAEAAARTVQEPTPAKLRNMIDMITNRIRDDGQFDDCEITLRELRIVAESFVKVLMGIHHHRIAYPGYDFDRSGSRGVLTQVPPATEWDELTEKRPDPASTPDASPSQSMAAGELSGD